MKARVIATGKIVDVVANGNNYDTTDKKERYYSHELDFNDTTDYWTRLEHQAAIGAMQGILNNPLLLAGLLKVNKSHEDIVAEVIGTAGKYAHAFVDKYKRKENENCIRTLF